VNEVSAEKGAGPIYSNHKKPTRLKHELMMMKTNYIMTVHL